MSNEIFQQQEIAYLTIPLMDKLHPSLIIGFTASGGGTSTDCYSSLNMGLHVGDDPEGVRENRRIMAEKLDLPLQNWVYADQVHDNKIYKAASPDKSKGTIDYSSAIPATDGLYTKDKNLMLALCYADCVPLYFFDKEQSMIGTAHAGWKGTVKNIAGEMVKCWVNAEKSNPANIAAAIGPSIGPCCYTVDDRVIQQIELLHLDGKKTYDKSAEGQYSLNLKELNRQLLIKAGLKEENIYVSSYCTSCEKDLFFSHRRDTGKTGRMIGFIGMKEEEASG
ncbi:peptidoglycan editing factor PgeF [Metabacillus sp. RGM 3146]|uniref:peptidoglycan editing factor PgeF n=1 Tax=Metabacillus sp. RGM 3146 TaxID=3401092 RepID=UPI003B99245A